VLTDGVALALVRDPTRSLPWLVTTTALYQVPCYVYHCAIVCVLLCLLGQWSSIQYRVVCVSLCSVTCTVLR
jgi:hypothetical protein